MWLTLIGSPVSGSGIRQIVGVLVMQIEDLGQRVRGAGELGMVDDVGDALAVDPDLARRPAGPSEIARPCVPASFPPVRGRLHLSRHDLRKRRSEVRIW